MAKDCFLAAVFGPERAGCSRPTPAACPAQANHARRPTRSSLSSQDPFIARPVPTSRGYRATLLLFHYALQRVLVLARKIHHLRHLGLGDLVGKNAALAN